MDNLTFIKSNLTKSAWATTNHNKLKICVQLIERNNKLMIMLSLQVNLLMNRLLINKMPLNKGMKIYKVVLFKMKDWYSLIIICFQTEACIKDKF